MDNVINSTAESITRDNFSSHCRNGVCHKNDTAHHVGYKFFSEFTITLFLIVYILVFVIGMLGNILTCTLMIVNRQLRRAVHIYTFNLAICDILILSFYVPTQVVMIRQQLNWVIGIEMCKIANIILPVTLACTIGCLLAIALDRARAILCPIQWRSDSLSQSKIVILVIWLISILVNIPLFIYPKLIYDGPLVYCYEGWPELADGEFFWVIMFTFLYCLPLVVMVIAYVSMVIYVQKSKFIRELHQKYHKKMVVMGIRLVAVFAICTGFQHYFFFVTSSFSGAHMPMKTLGLWYAISNWFVSLQAAINPFIYRNIRKLYKETETSQFVSTFSTNIQRRLSRHSFRSYGRRPDVVQTKSQCGHGLKTGLQNIEGLLNSTQLKKSVYPPFPCSACIEADDDNVLQMILNGEYVKAENFSELASTHL